MVPVLPWPCIQWTATPWRGTKHVFTTLNTSRKLREDVVVSAGILSQKDLWAWCLWRRTQADFNVKPLLDRRACGRQECSLYRSEELNQLFKAGVVPSGSLSRTALWLLYRLTAQHRWILTSPLALASSTILRNLSIWLGDGGVKSTILIWCSFNWGQVS